MDVVELGGMRLHLLSAYPGLPGEADRVYRTLLRLAPAVVLGDLETGDALRLRAALTEKKAWEPGFVDALFRDEARRRFAPDVALGEHPVSAAARYARDRHAEFVPLRASGERPSFLARRRASKAARAVAASSPEALAPAFAHALAEADAWDPDADTQTSHRRLLRALSDGRAPVVAVLQAHRAGPFEDAVLRTGRIPA